MTTPPPFVLASASSGRLGLLRRAGLDPEVMVSGADESVGDGLDTAAAVTAIAERKAAAVAAKRPDALVLGCDSLLEFGGERYGKPGSHKDAAAMWRLFSGQEGILYTGHCLIGPGAGRRVRAAAGTRIRFGEPTAAELDAYIATGEPLGMAGAFCTDGLGAPFIESITGDPGNVIGLSLPLLRGMLADLGLSITRFWPRG